MRKIFWLIVFLNTIMVGSLSAQLQQTVRGTVVDATSQFPLIGATVALVNGEEIITGTTTDGNGYFRLETVPVGRNTFKIKYVGYQEKVLNNIIVTSAKEVVLTIELEESTTDLGEIVVSAKRDGEVQNEMVSVSAREFSVDETNRYAGSRGDPARMASNFAGVQGADDSRNDIVIRGNSPQGVLWQVDGVVIPNPNHFAIPGTSGGPVSIINSKTLGNSDFYTGAFPAEFGNSIAGVFDLKLKNGNNEKHEFSAQLGILGLELFSEGPISKKSKSSFLFNYRYSTLSLFTAIGLDVGTNSNPVYQDITFRLNFPQKNGASLAIWGIGGLSNTAILISNQTEPVQELYGQNDRDQYFTSNVGVTGITYSYPINSNTFWKTTLAASQQRVMAHHERIFSRNIVNGQYDLNSVHLEPLLKYTFRENKYSLASFVYKKPVKRLVIKYGFMADLYDLSYTDSLRIENDGLYPNSNAWTPRWNTNTYSMLIQPYAQLKYLLTDKMSVQAGWHIQYYSINNALSLIEPRLGFKYAVKPGQSINFGAGLHSQNPSNYLFFYAPINSQGQNVAYNQKIGFFKSLHNVLGYNRMISKNARIKLETYYQYLFNIPVEIQSSSFSLVNTGSGFSRFFPNPLQNTGTGHNYGIEATVERFFANNYFFMFSGSLFQSKYRGSDGVLRNTDFNGKFAMNALGTKEFKLTDNAKIGIGTKVTWAGGRWYGEVNRAASDIAQEIIWDDDTRNTKQFSNYFRADLRITYTVQRPKVSHELAFDFVNILNHKNILTLTYTPDTLNPDPNYDPIGTTYQLGFLPLIYYKLDF